MLSTSITIQPRIAARSASPLFDLYSVCKALFTDILNTTENAALHEQLLNEFGRFRVWAAASRVNRKATHHYKSLDYQLRVRRESAQQSYDGVAELLKELEVSLRAVLIAVPDTSPGDASQHLGGGTGCDPLSTLVRETSHVITCLHNLLEAIYTVFDSDPHQCPKNINVSHYESFDTSHVENKYPDAPPWLVERLGKANTRRRRYFLYQRRHHDKRRHHDLCTHDLCTHDACVDIDDGKFLSFAAQLGAEFCARSFLESLRDSENLGDSGEEEEVAEEKAVAAEQEQASSSFSPQGSLAAGSKRNAGSFSLSHASYASQEELGPSSQAFRGPVEVKVNPDPRHTAMSQAEAREALNPFNRLNDGSSSSSDCASYTESEYSTAISSYTGVSASAKLPAPISPEANVPNTTETGHEAQGEAIGTQVETVATTIQGFKQPRHQRDNNDNTSGSDVDEDDEESYLGYFSGDGVEWLAHDGGRVLKIPDPPDPLSGELFTDDSFRCPYCFLIISTKNPREWQYHVQTDLRPYVCTFKQCPKPLNTYGNIQDWYNHELRFHRREWFCATCDLGFSTPTNLRSHLMETHSSLLQSGETGTEVSTIILSCQRPIRHTTLQACPICGSEFCDPNFKIHLAHHLQQLALFALPRSEIPDSERVGYDASSAYSKADTASEGDLNSNTANEGDLNSDAGSAIVRISEDAEYAPTQSSGSTE